MRSGKQAPLGSSGHGGSRAWFAPGAWTGLLLVLGRVVVIWIMAVVAHGGDPVLVATRLASALPSLLLLAFLAAFGAAVLLSLGPRSVGLRLLAALAVAGVFTSFLAGRWGTDASQKIGADTGPGWFALGCTGAGALVLALILSASVRHRGAPPAGRVRSLLARGELPLALAVAAALTFHLLVPGVADLMPVRTVQRSLLALDDWELLDSSPAAPPRAGVLCPSTVSLRDGADLPSLILPPPARVRLDLGAERDASPEWLVARAGIDHASAGRYPGLAVQFRVTLDGRVVFEEQLALGAESEWVDVGRSGGAGLSLAGARVVELSTRMVDADGEDVPAPGPVLAGFGGLTVERRALARRTRSSRERPNLVLIVMDTLRADRTSTSGYGRPTTPNLDALAARGVAFDAAYATSSWTWPSTASILTGLQPQEHGVTDATSCFLAQELETLLEALQSAGFSTAAWSANPLIVASKNFDQGFELFDATSAGGLRRSDVLVPAALDWLELVADWRFFLYLHLVDPHAPLTPLAEGRARFAADVPDDFDPRAITAYGRRLLENEGHADDGTPATEQVVTREQQRWISDLYDACVWSGDVWIGRVLDRIEELGLAERTLVVVTSDHGEELFEHGLATHGYSLFGESTRVPLVLAGPGVPAGRRVETPVSNRQLAPTLARLCGVELAGQSAALDLLQAVTPTPVLFSTTVGWWNGRYPQPLLGLRDGDLVLHLAPEGGPWRAGPEAGGQVRLFDLATDPGEREDLSGARPAEADRLRHEVEELVRTLSARRRSLPRFEAGGTTLEELNDLGY